MDDTERQEPQKSELVALRARIAALEQELAAERQHRLYHDHLLSNVNDAIIVLNPEFRIEEWNAGAERIYGWTENEVRGKQLSSVLQQRYLDPSTTSTSAFEQLLARGAWIGMVAQR
ncbi:hypothetical protein SE17_19270, partial [Kouleothrix aurantiaca]